MTVRTVTDRASWDAEVLAAGGHPLQLWGWGEVKAAGPWTAHRVQVLDPTGSTAGLAQVLVRTLPAPFRALSHVPRGPVVAPGADRSAVTSAVVGWCRSTVHGVGVTLEPPWPEGTPLDLPGARPSPNPVLFPTTLVLDLTRSEDELLADMSRTTRQGVRRSQRTDLAYRQVGDRAELRACLEIYHETARRAGFALHEDAYYERVADQLDEHSAVFAAFDGPRPVAFVWLAASARTAFELYAGADDEGRRLRANYALKWTAIRAMKARGLAEYDMNGLLNDGISEFKRSFAHHEDRLVGSLDVAFSPWYPVWNLALPRAKRLLRAVRGGR